MRVNPTVRDTPMKNRGGRPLSVEVAFSLTFRPDGSSDEEDAVEREREKMKDGMSF